MHAQTAHSQRRKGTSLQVFGSHSRPLSSSPVTLTAFTLTLCLLAQPDSWVLCGFFLPKLLPGNCLQTLSCGNHRAPFVLSALFRDRESLTWEV